MSSDGRAAAWLTAWRILETTQKQLEDEGSQKLTETQQALSRQWREEMDRRAAIYARLATADMLVGTMAGDELVRQAEAAAEQRGQFDDLLKRMNRERDEKKEANGES